MHEIKKDIYLLPSGVLFILALYDLIRGIMHTFLLSYSASHIAQFDLQIVPMDQVFMLGVFGMSNFLTGFIYLLIVWKVREISPYVLIIIPCSYLVGLIGIRLNGIHAEAHFYGRYGMIVYFAICVLTYVLFHIQKRKYG